MGCLFWLLKGPNPSNFAQQFICWCLRCPFSFVYASFCFLGPSFSKPAPYHVLLLMIADWWPGLVSDWWPGVEHEHKGAWRRKECAEVSWESPRSDRTSVIQAAVSNQNNIIATLRQRFSTNFPSIDQEQPEVGDGDFSFLSKCNCNPSRRARGKQLVCTNMTTGQNRAVLVAKPEINFIQAKIELSPTPIFRTLGATTRIFSLSFRPRPANQTLESLDINLDLANLIRKHSNCHQPWVMILSLGPEISLGTYPSWRWYKDEITLNQRNYAAALHGRGEG